MRRAIVLFVCLVPLALAPPLRAQERLKVNGGLIVGTNLSTLGGGELSELAGFEDRTTMGGGIFVSFPITGGFSIQPEVRFAAKGAKADYALVDTTGTEVGDGTSTYKLDYVHVPLLLRFTIPTGSAVRPVLYGAPDFAFNVASTITFDDPAGYEQLELEDVAKFDFGMSAGGGLDITLGGSRILLDARYTWGMTEVFTSEDAAKDKNRTLSFSVGYAF